MLSHAESKVNYIWITFVQSIFLEYHPLLNNIIIGKYYYVLESGFMIQWEILIFIKCFQPIKINFLLWK